MKIEVFDLSDIDDPFSSGWRRLRIDVDGETVFNVHNGEPEDNNLSRNFNDCLKVVELLKMAYEQGQFDGPDGNLEIETTNEDPE